MHSTPRNWKEARRHRAWHLKQKGWSQRHIAAALGVSEAAVSQWMQRARLGGLWALRHRPLPGAPRRLSADQLAHLPALWRRGPTAYGFRGDLWTRKRVAEVIRLACGVVYHHSQGRAINSADVVAFLEHLLHEGPGRTVLIWNGSPIHRRHTIMAFLAHGAARRLHLKRLPAYAPDLHPDEGLWQQPKGSNCAMCAAS